MQSLELKIPPPVVGLLTAGAMWYLSTVSPALDVPSATRIGSTIVLALIGATFDLAGLAAFLRSKTTINPMRPAKTSALVTAGVYRVKIAPEERVLAAKFGEAWAAYQRRVRRWL